MRGGYLTLAAVALAALLLVLPAAVSYAEFPDSPDQAGAWTGGDPVVYAGRNLTQYIDGAAEVYFAYSFRAVLARQYTAAGRQPITLDIFDMGSSYDAYGVFTFERMGPTVGLGQGSEYDSGLLRFWKGVFFVSVYTPAETTDSRAAILQLGKAVAEAIPDTGPTPDLVGLLPRRALRTRTVRYFHDFAQLNYQYFVSPRNILGLGRNTECALGTYDFGPGPSRVLIARYPNRRAADTAHWSFLRAYSPRAALDKEFFLQGRGWIAVHIQGNAVYIVFDAPDAETMHKVMDVADYKIWRAD